MPKKYRDRNTEELPPRVAVTARLHAVTHKLTGALRVQRGVRRQDIDTYV